MPERDHELRSEALAYTERPLYAVVLLSKKQHGIADELERHYPEIVAGTKTLVKYGPLDGGTETDARVMMSTLALLQEEDKIDFLALPRIISHGQFEACRYVVATLWQGLGPEVENFIQELAGIRTQLAESVERSRADAHWERAYEVGLRLHELGGIPLMQAVHTRVSAMTRWARVSESETNLMWIGIGQWAK
jgi:hypothetical protein